MKWFCPCHVKVKHKVKVTVSLSPAYGFPQRSDGGIAIVHGPPRPAMSCFKSTVSHANPPLGHLNGATMTSADALSMRFKETAALAGLTFSPHFLILESSWKTFPKNGINWDHTVSGWLQRSKTTPSNIRFTISDKLTADDFQDLLTEEFQSKQICTISK